MNESNNKINKLVKKVNYYQIIIVILVLLGLVVYALGVYIFTSNQKSFNEFGDFVGGAAGSLWSLAGIIYVYIAFVGQQIQVEYQKMELDFTQSEFLKQSFENSFFNLLQNHLNIVHSLDVGTGETKTTGSDCFKFYYKKLESIYRSKKGEIISVKVTDSVKQVYAEYINDLDHTFKSVLMLMNHIDLSTTNVDKQYYYQVLFSQLSQFEKILLFYFSLHLNDIKILINKYKLLNHLNKDILIEDQHVNLFF